MVWTCGEMRERICRTESDEHGIAGKEKKRLTKEDVEGQHQGKYGDHRGCERGCHGP